MVFFNIKLRGPGSSLGFKEDNMINGLFGKVNSNSNASVKKSYLAVSNCVPIEGSRYVLQRIEYEGEFFFPVEVKTSKILSVNRKSDDVFLIETSNSFYYVKVLGLMPSKFKLAVAYKKPISNKKMNCFTIRDAGATYQLISTFTSYVESVIDLNGVYEVKTRNSLYYLKLG